MYIFKKYLRVYTVYLYIIYIKCMCMNVLCVCMYMNFLYAK